MQSFENLQYAVKLHQFKGTKINQNSDEKLILFQVLHDTLHTTVRNRCAKEIAKNTLMQICKNILGTE